MKFTTGIFFFILISICFVANAQKAFDQVRALMRNLRNSNADDQAKADVREKAERAWCTKEIGLATKLLARRQHDVDSLEAHIKWLVNTRAEARKDRASRIARIKSNLALLEKFKKQRCENNLLFVKQLREHMQAVAIMKLLRGDIVAYFAAKPKGQQGVFIEQFEEYLVLLDEEHKQIFSQLKTEVTGLRAHVLDRSGETQIKTRTNRDVNRQGDSLTAQRERTAAETGRGHVDNTRGALQRLKTPEHEKIGDFNRNTRKRVLGMIDNLIRHLRASRRKLTADEIHAAEDFAVFHNSMEQENEYLAEKIKQLTAEIHSLTSQLRVSRAQLVKRKALRDQAAAALKLLQKMCAEKYAYFARETTRRNRENVSIDAATSAFQRILKNLSKRVRSRASNLTLGVRQSSADEMGHRVTASKSGVTSDLSGRVKERAEVVF
jgi:hypothetical protein